MAAGVLGGMDKIFIVPQWFFQGIFDQWKSTGNLLWIHGKRVFPLSFITSEFLINFSFPSWIREECSLVCPPSISSALLRSHRQPSSSIVQDIFALSDAGRASVAYFYFDFRDIDKQKLQDLLPSLLIQLSARSDHCCDILSQLHSAHDRGTRQPNDRTMIECLKEMLRRLEQGPTYIILDALDECPITSGNLSPREEVLKFVDELVGLRVPNFHICVTSRPEHDIRVVLEPLTAHPVSLHDESGQKQDIAEYVGSFVHSDRRMRRWREDDKDLVISTLSEKADGM